MTAPTPVNPGEIATTAAIARLLGTSRQALSQAMARTIDPPVPVLKSSTATFYKVTEVQDWWTRRAQGRIQTWNEKREHNRGPSAQLNVRISSDDYTRLWNLRKPDEAIAAVARRALLTGLAVLDGAS